MTEPTQNLEAAMTIYCTRILFERLTRSFAAFGHPISYS